ncbi:MAG TPA: chorismate synthase [Methanosarcinales archaeon]|nr:chorismate synthase [Methanosarcinales archaeon]
MSGNTFGTIFRVTTWGESHGPAVGVTIDGCPSMLPVSVGDIQKDLDRRRPGQSDISTPRKESDTVTILSGVFEGKTTGTPISMVVWNRDVDSSPYEALMDTPRPGHADYPYWVKYGIRDYRGGGRASARETIGRVAAGAIAKKVLADRGIDLLAHVVELGGIRARRAQVLVQAQSQSQSRAQTQEQVRMQLSALRDEVERTPLRCADLDAAEQMQRLVQSVREEGDSIGGIVEIIATNVPAGTGEPVFDKLDADLAKALMGIGAVKGVEIGAGFGCATMRGSEMNDSFGLSEADGQVIQETNAAGGILGGLATGAPIVCRIAVKPTPSIAIPQKTINLMTMTETEITIKGRHDPTIPPRIVPVAEAMVAIVLADHLLRDSVSCIPVAERL